MPRRLLTILPLLTFTFLAASGAESIPKPDFDRVDHEKPAKYLKLNAKYGSQSEIRKIAKGLEKETLDETLLAIHVFVNGKYRWDKEAFDSWRNYKEMTRDRSYGGCADYAVLFGSLTRACGIPTVWVKTMDAAWIRDFVAGRPAYGRYRGHVFLEIHDGKRWLLLEPQGLRIYEDYSPLCRILPGERWAYDKGGDPFKIVLSVRWEDWKVQTKAHFRDFDLTKIPVTNGRRIARNDLRVLIVANKPVYQWIGKRLRAIGITGDLQSINGGFEEWLPKARGRTIVIASLGGKLVLPDAYREAWLPRGFEKRKPTGVFRGTLPESGTKVIVVSALGLDQMKKVVETLTLD